jgi:oxygen-independent coproporphyrinogen III oxidase
MAGIYIHIPFCKSRCDYCNFFSLASKKYLPGFAKTLSREVELRKSYLDNEAIDTIYFGGGTPTMLEPLDIEFIMNAIHANFVIKPGVEITLEANPDDLNKEKLNAYKQSGINRLSIGIQSFSEDDLQYLSRRHDRRKALICIEESIKAGFSNTTIDLIFGLPTQNIQKIEENLRIFHRYQLPHLSAYALTVEPGTTLSWKIERSRIAGIEEGEQSEQFLFLMDWMENEGYLHYEISNYCLPGFESKHNAAYWSGRKYLGLGPSAHSYDGSSRQWNIARLDKYVEGIHAGQSCFEREIITPEKKHNEFVMTAIRTMQGINLQYFEKCNLALKKPSCSAETASKLFMAFCVIVMDVL